MLRLVARSSLLRSSLAVPLARRSASTTSTAGSGSALKTGIYATVLVLSTGLFAAYYFDSRSALHRYVFTPLLRHTLDPEASHKFAVQVLRSGLAPRDVVQDDEVLRTEIWGEQLNNPVGVAAGFDKHGEAVDGLLNLGFSWVEIGSVTPKPQPGNPQPRVFHLVSDAAMINRYGFPSDGHKLVLSRLEARLPRFQSEGEGAARPASLRPGAFLAVNLGKNKSSPPDSIDDFVEGVRAFGAYADVLVINVSSPNTPGLRGMQTRTLLEELLAGAKKARDEAVRAQGTSHRPKLVLKIAPDLEEAEVADIASVVRTSGVDGVIVSNTTIRRPSNLHDPNRYEAGGLSGPPLKPYALATLRTLRAQLPATVPIIGCGGISSGADALEFARAGASAVQVYTGFGYDGVGACRRIKDELVEALRAEGTTWREVSRRAVEELAWKGEKGREAGKEALTVGRLVEEAEELKKLVDGLGERIAAGPAAHDVGSV
ncbi:hypothetical protein CERSUDRAFT_112449 [Gelatoporia subvermispora B]|uniref:Dihydroorotate dehydrogenase (quinone), mitochondrial n=1 Tax=Ceriporiopsis subvermispora (strain B) TaxID=914234 RepID=M2PQ97_CERS8|nr:hypothetical protein CERSUDRAFT_112449 [Gelatoporia subvermispora B]